MANITFVDESDQIIGYGTKTEAISKGIAHRIARIFVFNSKGELLIQKRSSHVAVPNRWDQSAAGHVDEGEDYLTAAQRELEEEIGVSNIPLKEVTKFYTEEIDDSMTKKRFNMLYSAVYDGEVKVNEDEVAEILWISPIRLEQWMQDKPQDFTQGFIQSYRHYRQQIA